MSEPSAASPREILLQLLAEMSEAGASDLLLAHGFPASVRVGREVQPLRPDRMTGEVTAELAKAVMNEAQCAEFERSRECNFVISTPDGRRFRVGALVEQGHVALVVRSIASTIPNLEALALPEVLKSLVMEPRGLVLVCGASGSGRSTTVAAMLDHRNASSAGHIITVEEPVEYAHVSKRSLVMQREVGVDALTWPDALKNALRQAPDMVMIGEIRDATMLEYAIATAEAGHLCLASVSANGAAKAIERLEKLYPDEKRAALRAELAAHLRAVVAQRLVLREDGTGRIAAVEVCLNVPAIADRITRGELAELKDVMSKSRPHGMRTFDWALFDLYNQEVVGYHEVVRAADSPNELRMNIKLKSRRGEPVAAAEETRDLIKCTPEELERRRAAELRRQEQVRLELEQGARQESAAPV